MAKKKNTNPRSQVSKAESPKPAAPAHLGHGPVEHSVTIHCISLLIGSWRKKFTTQQYKIIIAQALNDCTHEEILTVGGYLITERRVCLILKIYKGHIPKALQSFYDKVWKEILHHPQWTKTTDRIPADNNRLVAVDESFPGLFTQCPLYNDHLIRLITGRPVSLPYYDPGLARLKDKIHNYNFCSAMEYAGALGPVKNVTLITEKEWEAEYRRIHKEKYKKS